MTASTKPKTPNMTLDVLEGVSDQEVGRFCKRSSRLTLSQIVDKVTVKETLSTESGRRLKVYTVQIFFYSAEEYRREYCVTVFQVLNSFQRFAYNLKKEIQTELKKLDANLRSQIEKIGKGQAEQSERGRTNPHGGDNEEDDGNIPNDAGSEVGDGDAYAVKRARQINEEITYDENSDEESEVNIAAIEESYDVEDDEEKKGSDKLGQHGGDGGDSVEEQFLSQVKFARSFKCTPSKCVFDLEVSVF